MLQEIELTPLEKLILIFILILLCIIICEVIVKTYKKIKIYFIKKRLKELEMEDDKIKPFKEPKQQTITISEKDNYSFDLVVNVHGSEFIRVNFTLMEFR